MIGIAFSILALILIGGWRVTHLAFVGADPIVLRFAGLRRLPADRTVVRWLKRFSSEALLALEILIRDLVHEQIERAKLASLTLDLDGTVLRTGAKVEGTARGFNPHHPKDPSYYPLTAHVAVLGQILRVWNRPGNVNDAHNAAGFLRGVLGDLRARFGERLRLSRRMDGAFFMPQILQFPDEHRSLPRSTGISSRTTGRIRRIRVRSAPLHNRFQMQYPLQSMDCVRELAARGC